MSLDYRPPVGPDGLRHWQVAAGVIERNDRVLLVNNRRRNGRTDWSTPGGVVDPGETALEGLTREVQEETGLVVATWTEPLYRVEVLAPDLGFHLQVQAHRAVGFDGAIRIDDPDGIVIAAEFVARSAVAARLPTDQPWVAEPLIEHLQIGVADGRLYRYRIDGPDLETGARVVTRVDGTTRPGPEDRA